MKSRYKDFPPGRAQLVVPTNPKEASLAGLALYSPCKLSGRMAQRAAWWVSRHLGCRFLPWPSRAWDPPMGVSTWNRISEIFKDRLGPFDTHAIYQRTQADRSGLIVLLISKGRPLAFVKLDEGGGEGLRHEFEAASLITKYDPSSFSVPKPLALGTEEGWSFAAFEPLPVNLHRPVVRPPLRLILREVREALQERKRPSHVPPHWEPMHGDFTPWNLRQLTDGSIVLLDWEESGWSPPGADELLYLCVDRYLRGVPIGGRDRDEAAEFWERKFTKKVNPGQRDRRLARSILDSLKTLRPPTSRPFRVSTARPRVLIFAYAGEPRKGSEPAAGWGLIRTLGAVADCTVLTAPEHIDGIRAWETEHPESRTKFVNVEEAPLAGYAKWHRIPWFLAYLDWLRRASVIGWSLHAEAPFDAIHHATYSTYWLPSPSVRFGPPVLWGPMGGATRTPIPLWPILGWKGILDELLDAISVRLAGLWPPTRRTWAKAAVRLVQNEETLERLPKKWQPETTVLNHALFTEPPADGNSPRWSQPRGRLVLFLSPLESRKGPRLAVKAMLHCPEDVRLQMVGDGPERRSLERLVRQLNLGHRVDFLGRVPRERVFALLEKSAAALFTGVREEGGIALAEAMLCGTPAVVLSNGGARTLACAATDPRRVRLIQPSTVHETARRLGDALTRFVLVPPTDSGPTLDGAAARDRLVEALSRALATSSQREASDVAVEGSQAR